MGGILHIQACNFECADALQMRKRRRRRETQYGLAYAQLSQKNPFGRKSISASRFSLCARRRLLNFFMIKLRPLADILTPAPKFLATKKQRRRAPLV
jgi:hypothetical protein